ncbi:flavin reductase family protein [Candidatus Woesearchaeota archaeon]|nr:flavin reductase family protein [Candidatus Woesearchaeota archaeon]
MWDIINREDLFPSILVSVRAPVEVFGKTDVKDNISFVGWHMPASVNPLKYAISVPTDDNISRMISKAGNFVINFMGYEHKSIVLRAEQQDGSFVDLFDSLNLSKADSQLIESPRIKQAKIFLECVVEQELESGDHTIFIGRVVRPRG